MEILKASVIFKGNCIVFLNKCFRCAGSSNHQTNEGEVIAVLIGKMDVCQALNSI